MGHNRIVRDAKGELDFERINGEPVLYVNVDGTAALEMLNQRLLTERVELLRDRGRQEGTRKPRRPEVDAWIDGQLKANPAAKSPALWGDAPEWITEQIGEDRFAKRVTAARKRGKGRK
jgi:hypothetical protein